jgi:hypothetical protein
MSSSEPSSVIAKTPQIPSDWMTLDEAAEVLEKDKSSVSRYIRDGKLISNGKRGGKSLRVLKGSLMLMVVNEFDRYGRATLCRRGKPIPPGYDEMVALIRRELNDGIADLLSKSGG